MQVLKDLPIRRKALIIALLPATLGLLLACAVFMISEASLFPDSLAKEIAISAEIVGRNASATLQSRDTVEAANLLKALTVDPRLVQGVIYDIEGRAFAQYHFKNNTADFQPRAREAASTLFLEDSLGVYRDIVRDGKVVGTVYLESDLGLLHERMAQYAKVTAIVLVVAGLLAFLIASYMQRWISVPLQRVAARLRGIAEGEGDLTRELEVIHMDEVGEVSRWFNSFVKDLRSRIGSIATSAQLLGISSEQLASVSDQMTNSAEETSTKAGVASVASEQVSGNLQKVATAAEELNVSIREISKNAVEAAGVAGSAVEIAETTSETVVRLGDSSEEIGNVIKVITSIAEQTNLLALNATIEAARAGDAGKGFAVVANEVKELARGTAEATDDIGRRIKAIQQDTDASVTAIQKIRTIVNRISEIQSMIAHSVEEQTATTKEMGRLINECAGGGTEISRSISGVAQAAQVTTGGALDTRKAAAELASMATDLQLLVESFHYRENHNHDDPHLN